MNNTILVLTIAVLLSAGSCVHAQRSTRADAATIKVDGVEREYRLYVPETERSRKLPLVLVFHGGAGTALRMERSSGFSDLAEREGFAVAYPQGIGNKWNDGREFSGRSDEGMKQDLAFIKALIDRIEKDHKIDKKRIFVTGASNGGFFSNLLAAEYADRIAAIAPVIGGIGSELAERFDPAKPVSVFFIQGTDDPLVPFDGGTVARNRGTFVSTDEGLKLWRDHNGTKKDPEAGELADTNKKDGCRVETYKWSGGKDGTEVWLYKMVGGGHAWPGGSQYLPRLLIGRVCRDFDGTEAIWNFFKSHPKR